MLQVLLDAVVVFVYLIALVLVLHGVFLILALLLRLLRTLPEVGMGLALVHVRIGVELVLWGVFTLILGLDQTGALLHMGGGSALNERVLDAGRCRPEKAFVVLALKHALVDALVVEEAFLLAAVVLEEHEHVLAHFHPKLTQIFVLDARVLLALLLVQEFLHVFVVDFGLVFGSFEVVKLGLDVSLLALEAVFGRLHELVEDLMEVHALGHLLDALAGEHALEDAVNLGAHLLVLVFEHLCEQLQNVGGIHLALVLTQCAQGEVHEQGSGLLHALVGHGLLFLVDELD